MNPKVRIVKPLPDHHLFLEFSNGEQRVFDLTPYLSKGVFQKLRDRDAFITARVVAGSVEWRGGVDLSYDTLYLDSVSRESDSARTVA